MTYTIDDDLEQVYDTFTDEPPETYSDWSETHWRVSGKLKGRISNRMWSSHTLVVQRRDYVFLLFGLDHATDTVTLEVGYGPGECDLHFVDIPFDQGCSLETNILYWLAGLR